ncbi:MAG: hypothetical protein GY775_16075 [Candidatus Scalindua sp.]|nr:hypothetical protein [Candidatus Scalindua sp.]
MHSQQCVNQWNTTSDSCVTVIAASTTSGNSKLTSEADTTPGPMATHTVVAGCGDGTIHLYDSRKVRNSTQSSSIFFMCFMSNPPMLLCQGGQVIHSLKGHGNWIINAHFTGKLGGHEMISASADGDIWYVARKQKSEFYLFI